MELWQSLILAVVEGLTEYLPISSTGHIIIASNLMGINEHAFVKDYTVIVQFGAILSVLVLYWRRLITSFEIYKVLFVGVLPAMIIGLSVKNYIDQILGDVHIVAWALIAGGIFLILVDNKWKGAKQRLEDVTVRNSLMIGLCQCVAFIPGISRSASSILGGMWQGLDRRTAAEFSFLLALPTLAGACLLKLYKTYPTLSPEDLKLLAYGNVLSFAVGLIAVKGFIHFLSKFGFKIFGWYRIIVGIILLIIFSGHGQ